MFEFSACPKTSLYYLLVNTGGQLKEFATCKTDGIVGNGDIGKIYTTLFNDYVSNYSPLSAEVGDDYCLPSSKILGDFFVLGGVLSA